MKFYTQPEIEFILMNSADAITVSVISNDQELEYTPWDELFK